MKIAFGLLGLSAASHFRAGSLQYRKSSTPGKMEVTRYMGWRRYADGYGGCTQAHIDAGTLAYMGSESISGIGSVSAIYAVTNIEDSPTVDSNSHFCFGSYTFEINLGSVTSFDHTYSGCCTITLTGDNGSTFGGGFGYKAQVRDVNNSSPQFTSPPIWYIMDGCGGQTYHVNPVDPEGDTVRCRWSASSESHAMAWNSNLQQFSLDEENCIVTYHPEYDLYGQGSKPVAVQVEDFDSDGNLLHSVPLGFVGVVFTPDIEASRKSLRKNPLYAGLIEGTDDHDEHHDEGRRRRSPDHFSPALSRHVRSTEPDHCLGKPSFGGKSPEQGEERVWVWVPGLEIVVEWATSYSIGGNTLTNISRYQFSRPTGMTCTAFNSDGEATCSWFPTAAQASQGEHPHCVVVYDPYGRASDRQCVTLRVYPPCDPGTERVGSVCLPICNSGYERDADGNCVDIDECASGPCSAIEDCNNTPGSYFCSCINGYSANSAGTCVDVDECAAGLHTCAATTETCTNTVGSFTCPCSGGYERNASGVCVNIDECARGTDTCNDVTEVCNDTQGSYACSCATGYAANSAGTCVDVNECTSGSHTCAATVETCVNNIGSFTCSCSGGYERNGAGVCVNIDECARGTDSCNDITEVCNDNPGSFTCSCALGYSADASGTCVDVDECAVGTHTCSPTIETCVNNIGSFTCPCSTGYERNDAGVCVDIDECARETDTCAETIETCVNTIGSFDCPCSSGYERGADGVCVDIDECAREIDTCHPEKERCDNLIGSYECICLPMSYDDAMSTIRDWIAMTHEVVADHGRAFKFRVRTDKLLRNALLSYDANCTTAYDTDRIGKNDFAIWEKQAVRSEDHCTQATTVKAGLNAWVDNYACMDKKTSRQTHRVSKFIEKITNPYC